MAAWVTLLCSVLLGASPALAQETRAAGDAVPVAAPEPAAQGDVDHSSGALEWDERWSRFSVAQSLATGSMAAGILVAQLAVPEPRVARWQGAILLDDPARDSLRGESSRGRVVVDEASDWLRSAAMAMPWLDAGVAWTVHGRFDVALEIMAMNAQSFALTFLVTELTKRIVARERPYAQECGADETTGECGSGGRYKSFISGHTSTAFTGAGLTCAHHQNLPLYGGGPADAAACVAAVGAATAVGALRIAADHHYLSDVVMGAALGLLSGYGLPNWLQYSIGEEDPETGEPALGSIAPIAAPGGVGFGYQGVFH